MLFLLAKNECLLNCSKTKCSSETSNGIVREEQGETVKEGSPEESIAVRGLYKWTDVDGKIYSVIYVADENGFRPEGEHLPRPVQA